MSTYAKPLVLVYAFIMFAGGFMGYATKHSIFSLLSGVVSAVLLCVGYSMLSKSTRTGWNVIMGTTGALIVLFIERTVRTMHDPNSMKRNIGLAALSILMAVVFATCMNSSKQ